MSRRTVVRTFSTYRSGSKVFCLLLCCYEPYKKMLHSLGQHHGIDTKHDTVGRHRSGKRIVGISGSWCLEKTIDYLYNLAACSR